ncbi:MAG: hypothetical protein QW520_03290 [Methanomassiliicoccales archaeon]
MTSKVMKMAILGTVALAAFSLLALPALAAGAGLGDCDQTKQKDMLQDGSCGDCSGDRDSTRLNIRDRDRDGSCEGSMYSFAYCHCRQVEKQG